MFRRLGLFADYHSDITEIMSKRGYQPNIAGMCQGIAYMGMQAVLTDDLATFDKRVKTISSMTPEALALAIDSANQKRLKIVAQVKRAIGPFRELTTKEIELLNSQSDVQRKITGLEKTLRQLMAEQKEQAKDPRSTIQVWDEGTFEREFNKRKKQLLFNAMVQNKIEAQIEKLPAVDQISLDMDNFFDTVKVAFRHDRFNHLYPADQPTIDAVLSVNSPIVSVKQERRGGIELAGHSTGIYNKSELTTYLTSLHQAFQSGRYPVGCLLGNGDHAININYDDTEDKWILIDANNLPSKSFTSDAALAGEIIRTFSATKVTSFSTHFYAGANYVNDLKKKVQTVQNQPEWRAIHDTTNQTKINQQDDVGNAWLFQAAKIGDAEMVKSLLKHNANIEIERPDGVRPLHIAAQNQHKEVVAQLLQKKANPFTVSIYGSPLNAVAINGSVEIAKLLLDNNVDIASHVGSMPLLNAAHKNHLEIAKLLIEHNANINAPGNDGITPLGIAVEMGHKEMVQLLIENNADINQFYLNSVTPLFQAALSGNVEIVELLLAHQADQRIQTPFPISQLRKITKDLMGEERLNKFLAEKKKQRCVTEKEVRLTPLEIAAVQGDDKTVLLLEAYRIHHAMPKTP